MKKRILVIGAGVLGCNLSANLYKAGKDVTLLARGPWFDEIKKNGLRIKNVLSFGTKICRIPVIEQLLPSDHYDIIFVSLRYTQLDSIVDLLNGNVSKNIVFNGNNLRAKELAAKFPGKNVMFSFALSAGHRENDRVCSIDLKKITIGDLKGQESNESFIREIFEGTRYKMVYQPNMGDYLISHAGFVCVDACI